MKILKRAAYIRYALAKLSKFVKVPFLIKNVFLVILHKLAKFHHQTVFTSQII